MFGFRKKEKSREELLAVVDGTLIPIEDVKDPVFSQKMMGDGFAIASTGDTVYACADADITCLLYTSIQCFQSAVFQILRLKTVCHNCVGNPLITLTESIGYCSAIGA